MTLDWEGKWPNAGPSLVSALGENEDQACPRLQAPVGQRLAIFEWARAMGHSTSLRTARHIAVVSARQAPYARADKRRRIATLPAEQQP